MGKQKSDLSRAFSEDGALKTHVGGQALIEGIMMRGRYNWSVAVREPDGTIYTEEHDLASGKKRNGWMYWPIVRGCRAMVESLVLGFKALEVASMRAYDEEGFSYGDHQARRAEGEADGGSDDDVPATAPKPAAEAGDAAPEPATSGGEERPFSWKDDFGRPDTVIDALGAQRALEVTSGPYDPAVEAEAAQAASVPQDAGAGEGEPAAEPPAASAEEAPAEEKKGFWDQEVEFGEREMAISMVLGVVLGVVLFIVAPAFFTNLIVGEYDEHTLLWNIVDGVLRVVVFVFYIWLIGRMRDIKRMFSYHGAEHKTIHCYEHGLELTPENARSFPRLHVRCGTAFLIMVMIIAILVYTITPIDGLIVAWGVPSGAPKLALVIVVRILLMPVIAGISYEITVKWAGSHPDNPLVKVVLWPGMQMQYLTTNEPDDEMLECAIAAMKLVLEREQREEAAAAPAAPEPDGGQGAAVADAPADGRPEPLSTGA